MNIKWATNNKLPSHIQDSIEGNELYEEYSDSDTIEEFLEGEQLIEEKKNGSVVINEALKRIEQASLYQTLINHSLFAPNSARPEIMQLVENEIKAFAIERLEILLGMKNENNLEQGSSGQFNEEEVLALKAIAGRLVNKNPPKSVERTPTLNVVNQSNKQTLNPVQHAPTAQFKAEPIAEQEKSNLPVKQKQRGSRKSSSQKDPNRNYAQAGNPSAMPMPRDIVIEQPNWSAGINVNGVNISSAVLEHLKKE